VDVVVLDPLVAFHGVDENNNTYMHRLLDALRDGIREADAALILVHHEAKPAELPRLGGARLRGASAIHGAADNVILMLPEKDGKVRLAPEFKHSPPPEGGTYEGKFDEQGRFTITSG
jgi:RecA-family ATPase